MKRALMFIIATAIVAAGIVPAMAGVEPGETITARNAAQVENLVSPGNYVLVRQGMKMHIVPTRDYQWPPPYKSATEQYSSQVRLDDGGNLRHYVAGLPFPMVDPNDVDVARKIMWNFYYGPEFTDDVDIRSAAVASYAPGSDGRAWEYLPIGHIALYHNIGRTEVAPVPTNHDGDTGINRRLAIGNIIVPIDPIFWPNPWLYFVRYRYAAPRHADLVWSNAFTNTYYQSNSRIGSPMLLMNDAMFGNLDWNSLFGFSGKLDNWDFKFLGEKRILACVHARNVPAHQCKADGGRTICPEDWELRNVYVIEADARPPEYIGGRPPVTKRILYVDAQGWFITASDQYDRSGRLWKTLAIYNTVRSKETPDSKIAVYNFPRLFQTAMVDEDVQDGYSTILFTPNPRRPAHDTWLIDQGAISSRWIVPYRFTTFRQYFY